MLYFPLLVLKGIYHYWKYLFPGGLSNWKMDRWAARNKVNWVVIARRRSLPKQTHRQIERLGLFSESGTSRLKLRAHPSGALLGASTWQWPKGNHSNRTSPVLRDPSLQVGQSPRQMGGCQRERGTNLSNHCLHGSHVPTQSPSLAQQIWQNGLHVSLRN